MIAVMKAEPAAPIAPQHCNRMLTQASHGKQKISGVTECMLDWPKPAMPDMAKANQRRNAHRASSRWPWEHWLLCVAQRVEHSIGSFET
jgi:hypothetical protein